MVLNFTNILFLQLFPAVTFHGSGLLIHVRFPIESGQCSCVFVQDTSVDKVNISLFFYGRYVHDSFLLIMFVCINRAVCVCVKNG